MNISLTKIQWDLKVSICVDLRRTKIQKLLRICCIKWHECCIKFIENQGAYVTLREKMYQLKYFEIYYPLEICHFSFLLCGNNLSSVI